MSFNYQIKQQFLHIKDWFQMIDEMNDPLIPFTVPPFPSTSAYGHAFEHFFYD